MDIVEFIINLIRDEKNSSIFYSALADKCSDKRKMQLESISVECGKNVWLLSRELYSLTGDIQTAKSGIINKTLSVDEGVNWAIQVESECIENIKAFINGNKNTSSKILNNLLKGKKQRVIRLKNLKYML